MQRNSNAIDRSLTRSGATVVCVLGKCEKWPVLYIPGTMRLEFFFPLCRLVSRTERKESKKRGEEGNGMGSAMGSAMGPDMGTCQQNQVAAY